MSSVGGAGDTPPPGGEGCVHGRVRPPPAPAVLSAVLRDCALFEGDRGSRGQGGGPVRHRASRGCDTERGDVAVRFVLLCSEFIQIRLKICPSPAHLLVLKDNVEMHSGSNWV